MMNHPVTSSSGAKQAQLGDAPLTARVIVKVKTLLENAKVKEYLIKEAVDKGEMFSRVGSKDAS